MPIFEGIIYFHGKAAACDGDCIGLSFDSMYTKYSGTDPNEDWIDLYITTVNDKLIDTLQKQYQQNNKQKYKITITKINNSKYKNKK